MSLIDRFLPHAQPARCPHAHHRLEITVLYKTSANMLIKALWMKNHRSAEKARGWNLNSHRCSLLIFPHFVWFWKSQVNIMFALPQAHLHHCDHVEIIAAHTQTHRNQGVSLFIAGMHYNQSTPVCPTWCTPLQRLQRPGGPKGVTSLKPTGWMNPYIWYLWLPQLWSLPK